MLKDAALYAAADAAGKQAAALLTPEPMVVVQRANPFDDSSPIVKAYAPELDGPCGFAWINVPGNSAFGRYAKKLGHRKGYPKGIDIWVRDYRQSYQLKDAYARGFAAVLRANGVNAYAQSRLD